MKTSAAGRRYAKAIFALATEEGTVDAIRRELDNMSDLLTENPALGDSLFRPLHPALQRRDLLRAVCERMESTAPVRNFYSFLIDQRRLVDFPIIHEMPDHICIIVSRINANPLGNRCVLAKEISAGPI